MLLSVGYSTPRCQYYLTILVVCTPVLVSFFLNLGEQPQNRFSPAAPEN